MGELRFSLPVFGEGRGGVRERSEQGRKNPTLPSPKTGREKPLAASLSVNSYLIEVEWLLDRPVKPGDDSVKIVELDIADMIIVGGVDPSELL